MWFITAQTATADNPEVYARATVNPATGAWVGQAVALDVEVMTSTWFRDANDFPSIRIRGTVEFEFVPGT